MSLKEMAALGDTIRSEVLGSASPKVDDGDFMAPFDELSLAFCWGGIWGRDGLDRRTRSLLNLAILSTLNRPNQVDVHTRGALRNGCSPVEIREALLHVAAYAGIPAASDAFRIVRRVIKEEAEAAAKASPASATP
jgi:4-carboxymuconolactone decarboxylase